MLDIEIDSETSPEDIFVSAHSLAVKYRLTGYDAVYLELAMRKGLPLASLDSDLNKARSSWRCFGHSVKLLSTSSRPTNQASWRNEHRA